MAIKLKKLIQKYLEPKILTHGFQPESDQSWEGTGHFLYYKGDNREQWDMCVELGAPITREEIFITKNRFSPTISVGVRSSLRHEESSLNFIVDGSNTQKWWSIASEEEANTSFQEIADWFDKYLWDWFRLK